MANPAHSSAPSLGCTWSLSSETNQVYNSGTDKFTDVADSSMSLAGWDWAGDSVSGRRLQCAMCSVR